MEPITWLLAIVIILVAANAAGLWLWLRYHKKTSHDPEAESLEAQKYIPIPIDETRDGVPAPTTFILPDGRQASLRVTPVEEGDQSPVWIQT